MKKAIKIGSIIFVCILALIICAFFAVNKFKKVPNAGNVFDILRISPTNVDEIWLSITTKDTSSCDGKYESISINKEKDPELFSLVIATLSQKNATLDFKKDLDTYNSEQEVTLGGKVPLFVTIQFMCHSTVDGRDVTKPVAPSITVYSESNTLLFNDTRDYYDDEHNPIAGQKIMVYQFHINGEEIYSKIVSACKV